MALKLYYHPLSSFCWKALIAFYERGVPFQPVLIRHSEPAERAALEVLWPLLKFPVLRDEDHDLTLPEASLIVEYLDRAHPGPSPLVPADRDAALQARLWDRIFDNYVHLPMQKAVGDTFRPADGKDPVGVAEAKAQIAKSWDLLEDHLAEVGGDWATGSTFTLADCAAAPAMFYANVVQPFAGHGRVEAYFRRLRARTSVDRAIGEARPYGHMFPLGWPEHER